MGEGPAAALLPQMFEVDPLACPTCRGPMRIIACITQASVIDPLLAHLRGRAAHAGARSRPSTRAPTSRRPSRGAGEADEHAVSSTDWRPTPTEIPIPQCLLQ